MVLMLEVIVIYLLADNELFGELAWVLYTLAGLRALLAYMYVAGKTTIPDLIDVIARLTMLGIHMGVTASIITYYFTEMTSWYVVAAYFSALVVVPFSMAMSVAEQLRITAQKNG